MSCKGTWKKLHFSYSYKIKAKKTPVKTLSTNHVAEEADLEKVIEEESTSKKVTLKPKHHFSEQEK